MLQLRPPLLVFVAAILCVACASAPPPPSGYVEMRLLPGQSPVTEVDGPYAAYSRVGHGVIARLWPETIRDGSVDLSIIVQNTDADTIRLAISDVTANGETGPLHVAGTADMVARLESEPDRRRRPPPTAGAVALFGSSSPVTTGSTNDGAVKLDPQASTYSTSVPGVGGDAAAAGDLETRRAQVADWYLDTLEIAAGESAVAGVNLALPDSSQTIILNVDVAGEDHEFAVLFERLP